MPLKILLFLMLVFGMLQSQNTDSSSVRLDDLVAEALQANPDLSAMKSNLQALESRIKPAGTLPDPQLSLAVMNLPTDTWVFDQEPMTQKAVGLMQGLPFFGKLDLKQDIAVLDSRIAAQKVEEAKLQIIKMVKTTYYDLYFTKRAISITRDNKALMQNMVNVSEIRYRAGKGIQADWLNAQLELLKLDERLTVLEKQKATLKAKMNILLNRNPQQALGDPAEPPLVPLTADVAELQQMALEYNPQLRSKSLAIEKSKSAVKLSKRNYWPDFGVGVTYGQRVGRPDFFSGQVTMSIPLYGSRKQSEQVQEAEARKDNAQSEYSGSRNDIFYQIQSLVEEINQSKRLMELYQDQIIPQAEQAYNSALSAYSNDKLDYNSALNNLMMLFRNQLGLENNRRTYNNAVAGIEALAGEVKSQK